MRAVVIALLLAGCAHVPPGGPPTPTQQYLNAFGACMAAQGLTAAPGVAVQVWNILEQPGVSQAEMIREFENLGIAAASAAVQSAALCAVSAWANVNPVPPQPTPAHAAVRVIQSRYDKHHGAEPR